MDGGIEEILLALQILHLDSLRQRFRNFLHLGIYLLNNGIGIRTACLCNRDIHTGAAIRFCNEIIVQRTQFHSGYILDSQHLSIWQSLHNHILITRFFLVGSSIFQHILKGVFGISTQRSCGCFQILLIEHTSHICRNQSILSHLVGIQPNAHGIVGTNHIHIAHSWNSGETRFYIDFRVIGEETTVKTPIGTVQRDLLDVAGLAFSHRDTSTSHSAWQSSLHRCNSVLHIHHCHVGVGALTEKD